MNRPCTTVLVGALSLTLASCSAFEVADDHADHADAATIDGAPEIVVTAASMSFEPDRLELSVGEPVNIALTSEDILHDLNIDEVDFHLVADVDETAVGGLEFGEPGTYVAYCSVPGHRDAGMEMEVTVDG
ncbi:plastocyanin/azurin family copper-binding protein [Nitriliruptor alkaliphilus]|uniref:plastocyanin/azurin family copper-binding protein n=1 Tax=Nitriliruptor alkaliphilus TaxID=427918 RepID=UPI000698F6A3|nr:plastocyanin/azurin family copper-binding protein [Nitriliruptor alkaliphilus]